MNQHKNEQFRCPYCAMPAAIVWVHGHGQCSFCRINIDECCRGECCSPVATGSSDSQPEKA